MAEISTDEVARRRRQRDGLGKARPRGVLPYLPDDDLDLLRQWLTLAFHPMLPGVEFEVFDRSSVRKTDPCVVRFRNGRERHTFRFDRQADLQGAGLRAAVVGASSGFLNMPHLTATEIEDVWVALCRLARVMTEHDALDEATNWLHNLLDESRPLAGHTLASDGRHNALMAMRAQGQFTRRDAERLVKGEEGWMRRPIRFVDEQSGAQWLRSSETYAFVCFVCGARGLDRNGLKARLSEIEVEAQRFEAYQPPHPKLMLYRLTEPLVEYAESASLTPPPAASVAPAKPAQGRLEDQK